MTSFPMEEEKKKKKTPNQKKNHRMIKVGRDLKITLSNHHLTTNAIH